MSRYCVAFVISYFLCAVISVSAKQESVNDRIDRLHKSAIVIDAHSDYLDRSAIDGAGLGEDPPGGQTSVGKLREGQVDAQFFSVFVPPAYERYGYVERTHELIDRLLQQVARFPNQLEFATTADDIERISRSGKSAALMGIEGGHSIQNRLEHLRNYYRLGVRYMTLTWNNTNDWADASGDSARWSGLNDFGIEVVREMNRLGMMIDISHVSDDTFWDVMQHTSKPVIASHSLARSLRDTPRNMSDKMIKAMAENGGVVQVSFYSKHLDQAFADRFDQLKGEAKDQFNTLEKKYRDDPIQLDIAQWSLEKKIENEVSVPSYRKVVDHIDHIVQLVGPDHVGLGSDFDGMGSPPQGLEHIGKIKVITGELVKRGYSDEDTTKILGGNLLRVMRANEREAQ